VNDPFQLLGLEPRFDLESKFLDEQHKRLSLVAHPDRLRGQSAVERRQALMAAMAINEAHRTLRDPYSRGLAVLEARGNSRHDLPQAPLDPDALEAILEAREALSQARSTGNRSRIEELRQKVEGGRDLAFARIFEAFQGTGPLGAKQLALLDQALGELRYHERFLSDLESTDD
jgi:molecular chaperone HscB